LAARGSEELDRVGRDEGLGPRLAILLPLVLAHGALDRDELAFGQVLIDRFALLAPEVDIPETGFLDPLVALLAARTCRDGEMADGLP
jgi:hypothetical protein